MLNFDHQATVGAIKVRALNIVTRFREGFIKKVPFYVRISNDVAMLQLWAMDKAISTWHIFHVHSTNFAVHTNDVPWLMRRGCQGVTRCSAESPLHPVSFATPLHVNLGLAPKLKRFDLLLRSVV